MADACYPNPFLRAAFKGFAFDCTEAGSEHGRRGAEGEFPFAEHTAYADLGRRIRKYSLKAVFRKSSHVKDANAFIRVIESPGPGTLVHPTRGPLRAACKTAKVQDHIEVGAGETTVDLDFVEANEWVNAGFSLLASITGLQVGTLSAVVSSFLSRTYDILQIPHYDVPALESITTRLASDVRAAFVSSVGLTTDQGIADIAFDLQSVANDPLRATQSNVLWSVIQGGVAAIDRYGQTPDAQLEAFRAITNWTPPIADLSRVSVAAREAIQIAVRLMGAAHMARTATTSVADNLQQGLDQYDKITMVLSEEATFALARCDNALFLALREFLGQAQKALLDRAYNLPALIEYQFNGGVSSLVASYEIYGDAKRFRELERLNGRSQPFLLGPSVVARADQNTRAAA